MNMWWRNRLPAAITLFQQRWRLALAVLSALLLIMVLWVVFWQPTSSPTAFLSETSSSKLSRLAYCQQAAKVLAQQQLNLNEPPTLIWEFEREEIEAHIHIQIILSFQIDADHAVFVQSGGHKRLLPKDEALNIVCRYPYKLIRLSDYEDEYESIPHDIIFDNQMIALPQHYQ
ncbi:MAG TPA: hypothetical protein ENK78_09180 [Thiothrix sp.]|nr:hypothetical protein [Thiothrix sp.]